jgi:hypothetical protein
MKFAKKNYITQKNYKNKQTCALKFQITKNDLKLYKLGLYPMHKYLKPHSHLNWFKTKTQTTKLTKLNVIN